MARSVLSGGVSTQALYAPQVITTGVPGERVETTSTNARLVAAAQRGDRAAFGALYERYGRMVHGLLLARLPPAEVDDLVQEVFLTALRRLGSLRDPAAFGGWLATIARRLMINFLSSPARQFRGTGRSSVLEQLLQLPDGDPAQSQIYDLELTRRVFDWAARQVQEQVEPSTWEAFWRTAVEAQPVEAVAQVLAMSTGAVYIARSRVMRRLRTTVERHEIGQRGGGRIHD